MYKAWRGAQQENMKMSPLSLSRSVFHRTQWRELKRQHSMKCQCRPISGRVDSASKKSSTLLIAIWVILLLPPSQRTQTCSVIIYPPGTNISADTLKEKSIKTLPYSHNVTRASEKITFNIRRCAICLFFFLRFSFKMCFSSITEAQWLQMNCFTQIVSQGKPWTNHHHGKKSNI